MLHSPLNSPARSTCTRLLSLTLARTDKKRNAVGGGRKLAALALRARKSCPLGTSLASLAHESTCATRRNWPARAAKEGAPWRPRSRRTRSCEQQGTGLHCCTRHSRAGRRPRHPLLGPALATLARCQCRCLHSRPREQRASLVRRHASRHTRQPAAVSPSSVASVGSDGRHPRRSHRECAKSVWGGDGRTRRTRRTRSRNGENSRCGHETLTLKPLTLTLTLNPNPNVETGESECEAMQASSCRRNL
jgi:hypothetical protein